MTSTVESSNLKEKFCKALFKLVVDSCERGEVSRHEAEEYMKIVYLCLRDTNQHMRSMGYGNFVDRREVATDPTTPEEFNEAGEWSN